MTMRASLQPSRVRLVLLAAAIAAVLVVGGAFAVFSARAGTSAGPGGGGGSGTTSTDPGTAPDTDTGAAGRLQDPVEREATTPRTDATAIRVQIPSIGVDSGLEQLALDPSTGVLDPPRAWLSAGWYRDGTVPGDIGPAVIAGHVDSRTAPAVFARLTELTPGDTVTVTLSDGSTRDFTVDSQQAAPKDAFPTAAVYGPTPSAQLRLITCDGDFDEATGHYVDNLIVFASLAA